MDILDNYRVGWHDQESMRSLYKVWPGPNKGRLIDDYILAVGHNDEFIIAQTLPNLRDTSLIEYYVIVLMTTEDSEPDEAVMGPFDFSRFNEVKADFDISEMPFDTIFTKRPR